jgi:RNA polymerase-binding transcription factor DksA
MDAGDYGICESCGEAIPLPRLKAVPYAKLCLQCQNV